jgi:GR25 family glycosyltransferase involved in LPS biosynthesis
MDKNKNNILKKLKWKTIKNVVKRNRFVRISAFFFKRLRRRLSKRDEIKVFGSSKNEIGAAYVINLDRRKDRWEQIHKETIFQKIIGNKTLYDFCYRLPAIDGKELDLKKFNFSKIRSSYNLSYQYKIDPAPLILSLIQNNDICIDLSKEEVAVALSHAKAWQKIVDDNQSYALILEDDVFFEKEFANRVNQIWEELPANRSDGFKFDLLYLSFREVDTGADKQYYSKNLLKTVRGLWWNSGYVLSYSGAKRLLEELPIIGPVDLWMNHKFNKLDVYSAKNSIIFQRVDLEHDNSYSISPILSKASIKFNSSN